MKIPKRLLFLFCLGIIAISCSAKSDYQNRIPQDIETLALEILVTNFPRYCRTGSEDLVFEMFVTFTPDDDWQLRCKQKIVHLSDLWNIAIVEFPIITVRPSDCSYRVVTIGALWDSSGTLSYCPPPRVLAAID